MKELAKALKISILFQFICWGIFLLIDENNILKRSTRETTTVLVGIILLIGLLVLYFMKVNKYIDKNNLRPLRFNIFLVISWVLLSIIISYIFLTFIEKGYLHVCKQSGWECFLNGIEYALECILMILQASILVLIKSIIRLYKYIKSKKNTNN